MSETAPETPEPLLRLNSATLWVRDQERSRRFFVEQAGFHTAVDVEIAGLGRWVIVAPGESSLSTAADEKAAGLALVVPLPGSPEWARIGQNTGLTFLTEDVRAVFERWSRQGVRFPSAPTQPEWGSGQARYAVFEDVDGNSFSLIEFDEATRTVEAERRARTEKAQAERDAAHDAAVAREVQRRLLPQRRPELPTIDYAAVCLPARSVGGDYYDFLDFGRGRIGFVIGDIAGKGMAAALLMANLMAGLRGQSATAWDDPEAFLVSVNRQFFADTMQNGYTTLFFATYDDASRRLRYANCGHPPALLMREDGSIVHLGPTGTVMGLFEEWIPELREVRLCAGDSLAFYTDGVTEAANANGDEFGEERLVDALRIHRGLPAPDMVRAVAGEVLRFSGGEQADDITMMAVKALTGLATDAQ